MAHPEVVSPVRLDSERNDVAEPTQRNRFRPSKRDWLVLLVVLTALLSLNGSRKALTSSSPSTDDDAPSQSEIWQLGNNELQRRVNLNASASAETFLAGSPESASSSPSPLNIVLFYADDWTMKTLGKLNAYVHTPHLDAMADRGVLFSRNCVTTSICWQSRATMMTGVTTSVHRAKKIIDRTLYDNSTVVSWQSTLYPLLRRHGYHVGYVGKYHNAYDTKAFAQAFDWHKLYYGRHWIGATHVTERNAQDALEYLRSAQRPRNQSFCLTVSFFATHAQDGAPMERQYEPQPHSEDWYDNRTVPMPKTATEQHWKDMPWFFDERNEGRKRWKLRFNTTENYQYSIRRLYRMASEVDEVVGRVIEELKEQKVYNNTIIIFTTDNGLFHGEHGLADKWYPHEESIRVPLIIEDPRMPSHLRGHVNEELTLSVDLAPTILAAAGIEVPDFMQGRDMAQLYLDPLEAKKSWRQDFFYEWNQGHAHNASDHPVYHWIPAVFALIQKDYKYFYWPQVNYEQIFDLRSDPFEENDLWNVTSHTDQATLLALRDRYLELKQLSQSGQKV